MLIGVDAAIGVPREVVLQYRQDYGQPQANFLDWIDWLFLQGEPDHPVQSPDRWHYSRPFIAIPPGKGSRSAFPKAGIPLHRGVEAGLNANSPLIVSGIPGTVGSGSRELWRELVECRRQQNASGSGLTDREWGVWPFEGDLQRLLKAKSAVVAEIYPKACYGMALSPTLPARIRPIAKTRQAARAEAIASLLEVTEGVMRIQNLAACYAGEDDFDAMISVVALKKFLELKDLLVRPVASDPIEGSIFAKSALILS